MTLLAETLIQILKIFSLLGVCTSICYWLISLFSAKRFFQQPSHPPSAPLPPVSILVPMASWEESSYQNLYSLLHQNYPSFEVIVGFLEAEPSILLKLEKMAEACPPGLLSWVLGGEKDGFNLKVCNLVQMERKAQHPLLLLIDADMQVAPDHLLRLVLYYLSEEAGLITCPYSSVEVKNWVAGLEGLGISTHFIPSVLVALLGNNPSFAFGSSILISRETLRQIGGLSSLKDYLADDQQLGYRVAQLGKRVRVVPVIPRTVLNSPSFRDFWARQVRWNRTIRVCNPWGYGGLIFTQGITWGLLLLLLGGGKNLYWLFSLVALGIRYLSSGVIAGLFLKDEAYRKYFWLLPLSDLLGTLAWMAGFGSKIYWQGRNLLVKPDGRLVK